MKRTASVPFLPALEGLYRTLTGLQASGSVIPFPLPDNHPAVRLRELLQQEGTKLDIDLAPWNRAPEIGGPEIPTAGAGTEYGQARVELYLAYYGVLLGLHYRVVTEQLLVRFLRDQDPVFRDSCVECFLAPESAARESGLPLTYWNFEFNPAGTLLAAFGEGREGRKALAAAVLKQIVRISGIETGRKFHWGLTVVVPLDAAGMAGAAELSDAEELSGAVGMTDAAGMQGSLNNPLPFNLRGRRLQANFYATGDDLIHPVYQCWSPVLTATPDFHRPEFFGELRFE